MPATNTTSGARAPLFVQQLARAAAQRGKLDLLYQDLSDRLTLILQRLYPVWALVGPGLSDPGHIEIHSRSIYLDADELLAPREQLDAGRLERRAVLRCLGVALHETFHAKHTKRWKVEHDIALARSQDPAERQLAADRQLLEEPRMEAHGCRDFPAASLRGRFVTRALQAAVVDVILPRFTAQLATAAMAGEAVTRDMAGRASVYLRARTHYGIVEEAGLTAIDAVWSAVLGDADKRALDDLYAKLIWIPDGETAALSQAARAYREIIGEPDPAAADSDGVAGQDAGDGPGNVGDDDGDAPSVESLSEALEHALAQTRTGQLEQLHEEIDLQELLDKVAHGDPGAPARGRGQGTGAPSGRMPDRGVDRPPAPDELQSARRYATRLRQALTLGTRQVEKRTPGGRFDGRAYTRARAQQASGRPVTSHPWRITRQLRAPIQAPHVAVIIDTSGSMGAYEYALGPIAWILTTGLRQIDGRCAIALFGNDAQLLTDGHHPLAQVPGIRTGGGTAFAGDAIALAAEQLEMTNPRRPRLTYVISDGGWYDTEAGVQKIRWLAEHDVHTIHLSIGTAPLSVECDRITVITDPADALDQIAADTVAALRAATGRRHTR
jgi:Mg-chelatase subunit ChlD